MHEIIEKKKKKISVTLLTVKPTGKNAKYALAFPSQLFMLIDFPLIFKPCKYKEDSRWASVKNVNA